MNVKYSALMKHMVEADDGVVGPVKSIVIDKSDWSVRFVLVDASSWLPGGRVAISTRALRPDDGDSGKLRCSLATTYIAGLLSRAKTEPATRQKEMKEMRRSDVTPEWILGEEAGALLITFDDEDKPETCLLPLPNESCRQYDGSARCQQCLNLGHARQLLGMTVTNAGRIRGRVMEMNIALPQWLITHLAVTDQSVNDKSQHLAVDDVSAIDWNDRKVSLSETQHSH